MKILILSDIHGNLAALRAVIDAEKSVDKIVCLGDLVDYGPQPEECVSLIRESAEVVVRGNHDYAVGASADPGCSAAYRHLALVTRDFTIARLADRYRLYLEQLPSHARFHESGAVFSVTHAAPTNRLFGYLPPDTPDRVWESEIAFDHDPDMLLTGHTHLPMIKRIGKTTVVNPGSVGQPKDGDPRAAYAVWEDGEITLKRAQYDIELTVDAFDSTGLSPVDIATLVGILRSGGTMVNP